MSRERRKLIQNGVKTLSDEELLLLLLDRTDALVVHKLLDDETDLADLAELARVDFGLFTKTYGLTEGQAAKLQAAIELGLRLMKPSTKERYQIGTTHDAVNLVRPDMVHLDHEQVRVLVLDTKNYLVANLVIYEGTVNSSQMYPGELLRPAVTRRCPNVIIVHNHPSGSPFPSEEDKEFTTKCVTAAEALHIELLDHLIIGKNQFMSLRTEMKWGSESTNKQSAK